MSSIETYHDTTAAVMQAISPGLRAGMSHEEVAELLRHLAEDFASGQIGIDPWRSPDSRSPELLARLLGRGGYRPHEIARSLRGIADELDKQPYELTAEDELFLTTLPGRAATRRDWLDWPEKGRIPYKNARHALAAGDREAVRGLVEALFGESPGGA